MNITNLTNRRSIYKVLLSSIFILYKKHFKVYFNKFKIWFNLELLIIYFWLNNSFIDFKDLFDISKRYFLNKCVIFVFLIINYLWNL